MKPENDAMASRRQFVGGVAAGLAAALQLDQRLRNKALLPPIHIEGPASQGSRIPRHNTRGLPSLRRRRSRQAL